MLKPYYQDNKVTVHVMDKLYQGREWLYMQYMICQKSAREIADQQGCCENTILNCLEKYGIKRRTISEARKIKYWGLRGKQNGMFGRTGPENPNWKGGISPERASFYCSQEWKKIIKRLWKRDKATCQRCKYIPARHGKLHAHHISGFKLKELRTTLSNLILLCKKCHSFVHSKANIEREFLNAIL